MGAGTAAPPFHRCAATLLHANDEFTRQKRLGEIIVAAQLKPDDFVHVLITGGNKDDGHVGFAPDQAQQLIAIDVREHDVENPYMGLLRFFQDGENLGAALKRANLKTGVLQIRLQ